MLISPLVRRGAVFQRPQGKPHFGNTSEFEHSSISATLKVLFNLTTWVLWNTLHLCLKHFHSLFAGLLGHAIRQLTSRCGTQVPNEAGRVGGCIR